MTGRALAFLTIFAMLQVIWQLPTTAGVRDRYVRSGIVQPAVAVAQMLTPRLAVRATGTRLRGGWGPQRHGLNIVNGCDGADMLFLLLAAFAVAPLSGVARLLGAVVGVGLVYALNLLRVLALFYTNGSDPALFDLLHGYLAPVGMIVLLVAYFHGCIVSFSRSVYPSV